MFRNFNYLILLLFLKSLLPVNNTFHKMQKISERDGYLVVLDTGLYLYDFENSNCRIIKNFNGIINSYNNDIIISKNNNNIKIVTLINYHLYIYDKENTNNEVEYKSLEDIFKNNNISPFYIQIENSQLILINIIYKSNWLNPTTPYSVNSYFFIDYSSASNGNKITKKLNDNYSKKIYCIFDIYNSLIKCIYIPFGTNNLVFVLIRNDTNQYSVIKEVDIDEGNEFSAPIISFTCSNNKDFVCDIRNYNTKCFYKNKEIAQFFSISYTFEKYCSELNTYYFEERKEFLMDCKIGNNYYLYIFDGNDINNNIIKKVISILNYNGKHSILYNNLIIVMT